MTIDKQRFFEEVTVRICSSLDIKVALRNTFQYLRLHFPLDSLSLTIHDQSIAAIRRIATVTADNVEVPDEIIPIPEEVWRQLQEIKPAEPTVMSSEAHELFRLLAPFIELEGYSKIRVPLPVEGKTLGSLVVCAQGEGRYDSATVALLAAVASPFSIALANALAYENVVKYRDRLLDDNLFLQKELVSQAGGELIGDDSGLKNVVEMVKQVAPLSNTVLLLGETGTGKEMIANAIHDSSRRKDGPFIKVNCGAIPDSLIDSELFGHEKGAFTGAVAQKRGRFERADGGTIFLDEIGELPPQVQVRLLRVLQNREIERVGGAGPIPVDIRVIAATHRNLQSMVSEGSFREDLWFRINVFPIIVPPLRQRRGDIPVLARHFIKEKCREFGVVGTPDIAPGALERLANYDWPGNVRELENLVEREVILRGGGPLRFDSLYAAAADRDVVVREDPAVPVGPLKLDEVIANHLSKVLELTNGKIHGPDGAAALIGMNSSTLRWRLDKLGIKYGRDAKRG
jgi:hydrogenase-4 transcriptional activator